MAFFNFGKTKNEQMDEDELIRNLIKASRTPTPTSEEAIKAIIEEFTPEQLDILEVTSQLGRKISFEKQLEAHCKRFRPYDSIQTIKKTIKSYIQKYQKAFDDKDMANDLFLGRCKELFKNSN